MKRPVGVPQRKYRIYGVVDIALMYLAVHTEVAAVNVGKQIGASIITDTVSDETGRVSARCKALLKFAPTKEGEEIYVKVGISAVDTEGAEKNLRAEIPGFDKRV